MSETLHDACVDDIRDASVTERQLTKALPKMAKTAVWWAGAAHPTPLCRR